MMQAFLRSSYRELAGRMNNVMPLRAGERVLDIGCGEKGNFLSIESDAYVGIDHRRGVIRRNNRRGDGRYVCMDARAMGFPDETFAYIVSTSFFHHLSQQDTLRVLEQSKKILKKNGRLIVADGVYPESAANVPGRLIRYLDRGRFVKNRRDMKALFARCFKVVGETYFVKGIFAYYVLVMENR